jgi:S1-C subfamily serine protease
MCAIVTTLKVYLRVPRARPATTRRLLAVWHDTASVTPVDLGLVVLLLFAGFLGYRRGAILQLFTYGGLLVGIVAGALLAPVTAGATHDLAAQAGIAVATLLLAAGIGDLVGWLLGGRLRARARSSRLGRADAAGGSLVALTATVFAMWLVSFSLANGPFSVVADQIQRSAVIRGIGDALPQPPSILGEVRRFFNAVGFPDVFAGLPPLPADPIAPPAQATAGRAFRAADDGTVRIVGQACGRIQQGSGFVVDGGLIVTNAHVVAGERATRVQRSTTSQDATVVLFDPGVDIAVLRVGGTAGRGLALLRHVVARGAGGAVVGYPGGGPLTGTRAAVRASIEATSRDIYGGSEVRRRLYELQATVVPGNSGGPFVLPNGGVAGVVVSASTTDSKLGYAIASTEVVPLLDRARGRSTAVPTGACVR